MVVQCPKPKRPKAYEDVFFNLKKCLENPGLKEEIVVLHDDMYILNPITEIPIFRGREVQLSVWRSASSYTMEMLKKMGCWTGISYEQHLPFICEKSKLLYVLDKIYEQSSDYTKVYWRTVYGNYFKIGGELTQDVKVRKNPTLTPEQNFVSSEDTTFEQNLKVLLEPMFPNKSNYEK